MTMNEGLDWCWENSHCSVIDDTGKGGGVFQMTCSALETEMELQKMHTNILRILSYFASQHNYETEFLQK